MELRNFPSLNEAVSWNRLPNGLTVAVIHRPGFTKKLCYFVTDFGAIHTAFTLDGKSHQVPAGVAHYLEHKMFDMPDRDVTAAFAALGATPNAFTGYDMTAYYFSCTENFYDCLKLLLEYVSTPYFTEESVQKEQGIIGQEIGMNEDNPDTRVFENLMTAMYPVHPINTPILGTRESISQITPQVLTDCHKAFYTPDNMLLCVVGDVDTREVCRLAEEILPPVSADTRREDSWQEDMICKKHLVTAQMEVAMPMFQLGFKAEPLGKGEEAVRQEAIGDLAAEALFGESSPLYLKLYEEGIIDSSFGGGFETVDGMSMLTASGDSDFPETVRDAIIRQAEDMVSLPSEDFLRMKRSAMGRRIRDLDSFDSVAFRTCAYHFSGFDYFRFPAVYQSVQAEDVLEFIHRVVTPNRCCLSVVEPISQEV